MRIARAICFVLIGIYISQIVFYYPNLPEYISSNFDGSGNPQAWTSKRSFFLISFIIMLIPTFMFLFMPKLMSKFPDRFLNIPNRDYWLANERRDQTFEKIAKYFEWLLVGVITFSIIVTQMVINANIGADKKLSNYFLVALIGFLIYIIAFVIKFFITFRYKA